MARRDDATRVDGHSDLERTVPRQRRSDTETKAEPQAAAAQDDESQTVTQVARRRRLAPETAAASAPASSAAESAPRALQDSGGWDPQLLPLNSMVDYFKVVRLLGRGSMGEVYLARDTRLGRKVALKVVQPSLLGSADAIARFLAEARITARFDHPHIVTIHAVGEVAGRPYLAMAYLEGEDLRCRMRARQPSVQESLRIGLAIAEALTEAHEHGVLHRDLKPANVVIGRDGRLRVVDFGLAKTLAHGDAADDTIIDATTFAKAFNPAARNAARLEPECDAADTGAGTPGYMAPEQWQEQVCSGAADVWALGVVLFELCAGRRPFVADDWAPLALAVTGPEPAPPLEHFADVPAALAEVVGRCLRKTPAERPTAAQAAETLRSLLRSPPTRVVEAQSPFCGLLPFDEHQMDRFFGRDAEISAATERLRIQPVLLVVGRSGAGKTSFVQAGVVPRLREQGRWLVLQLRPGPRPLLTLASRLLRGTGEGSSRTSTSASGSSAEVGAVIARALRSVDDDDRYAPVPGASKTGGVPPAAPEIPNSAALAERLHRHPQQLSLLLRALAEQTGAQVLLVVDQLEELFTLTDDAPTQRSFLRAVGTAADDPTDPIRVVITVRDDFLGRLATDPDTSEALSRVTVLRPLDADALRAILRRPVEAAGYRYEDAGLIDEMVDAVLGGPAPLPLLQFAAQRLWEQRDQNQRLLTRAAYERMGGVGGALGNHADGVLGGLSSAELGIARQLLLRLVTPERTRRVISKKAALHGLADEDDEEADQASGPNPERVLDRLTAARLVSVAKARGRSDARATLELAHESLIHTWPALGRWLDEGREELAFVADLVQAATLWKRRGRLPQELWRGDALADALRIAQRFATPLPREAAEFLQVARERDQWRVRRKRFVVAAALAVLGAVALVAAAAALIIADREQEARTQRERAELRETEVRQQHAEALREGARSALGEGQLLKARAKLRLALESEQEVSVSARAVWWRLRRNPLLWSRTFGGIVYSVAFSPDGQIVAVSCQDNNVYLVDIRTGQLRALRRHQDQVFTAAFSPDGASLATAGWTGDIRLWDVASGAEQRLIHGSRAGVRTIAYHPDGKLLAAGDFAHEITLWDPATGERKARLEGHQAPVVSLRFSPDGHQLASASLDRTVGLWDVASGAAQRMCRGHDNAVLAVDYRPDGNQLVSSSVDRSIRLWDPSNCKPQGQLDGHRDSVISVAFSPDGRSIVSGSSDYTVRLWDGDTGAQRRVLRGHEDALWCVGFSPDGSQIASGSADGGLRLWSAESDDYEPPVGGHGSAVVDVQFHPDGRTLASGGADSTVRIWDTGTGEQLRVLRGHDASVETVGFSPAGQLLASGSADDTVRLWNPQSGAQRGTLTAHDASISSVAFSPDGRHLASASSDHTVRLWRVGTAKVERVLEGHSAKLQQVAFGPDGAQLVTAAMDGSVRLWDAGTGKPLRVFDDRAGDKRSADISPDGRWIAAAGQGGVWLWALDSGAMREIGDDRARVYDVAFHPDGERIGTAGVGGAVRIIHLSTAQQQELRGHRDDVNALAFSPDGELVATVGDDTTVRVWRTADGRPFWHASALLGSPPRLLTHRGWQRLTEKERSPSSSPPTGKPPADLGPNLRKALQQRTRFACDPRGCATGTSAELVCLHTHTDELELWNRPADERLARHPVAGLEQILALPEGCVARSQAQALLVQPGGQTVPLAVQGGLTALGGAAGRILLAAGSEAFVFDASGEALGRSTTGPGVTALTLVAPTTAAAGGTQPEPQLVVGYRDGSLELLSVSPGDGGSRQRLSFQHTPSSAPVRILAGPRATVIVGFAGGSLGIWSQVDGARLVDARLHGRVVHLLHADGRLFAATDLGGHLAWDMRAFHQDDCELLRDVWRSVPIVWEHGRPVLREPPRDHRCR